MDKKVTMAAVEAAIDREDALLVIVADYENEGILFHMQGSMKEEFDSTPKDSGVLMETFGKVVGMWMANGAKDQLEAVNYLFDILLNIMAERAFPSIDAMFGADERCQPSTSGPSGLWQIIMERVNKQVRNDNRSFENDFTNYAQVNGEGKVIGFSNDLLQFQRYLLTMDEKYWPNNWREEDKRKYGTMGLKERIRIAGALSAAILDLFGAVEHYLAEGKEIHDSLTERVVY